MPVTAFFSFVGCIRETCTLARQQTASRAPMVSRTADALALVLPGAWVFGKSSITTETILKTLKAGGKPKPGSQIGRHTCEPAGGLTTLIGGQTAAKKPGKGKEPGQ